MRSAHTSNACKMIRREDIYKIGYIARAHGLAGEVDLMFTDDVFDRTEANVLFLMLDGLPVPFFIDSYRFKNRSTAIMKFEDVDDVEHAQQLCGAEVYFPLLMIPEREEEPLTWNYLTGFSVDDVNSGHLGVVDYVDDRNVNLLLCIKREAGGEVLVPFHEDFLVSVDEKARVLTLQLPEGLLDLNN